MGMEGRGGAWKAGVGGNENHQASRHHHETQDWLVEQFWHSRVSISRGRRRRKKGEKEEQYALKL